MNSDKLLKRPDSRVGWVAVRLATQHYKILLNNNWNLSCFLTGMKKKNLIIKQQRGVGFEDVVLAFKNDKVLDIIEHHNSDKYPNQKIFVIELNGYVHYVPFVKDVDRYFLKNIIPSRKLHNLYKKR